MNKKSFILFISLLVFWLIISEALNLQHIIVGIVLALFSTWFWMDLTPKMPRILYPRELLHLIHCIIMLIGYVIKSNIDVARTLLFSDLSESSMFLEFNPRMESDWGRVLLATFITITPGTATIDFNPDTNIFTVHALTRETGINLYYWRLINEIKNLEILVHRRDIHVVDNGRVYGSDSTSSIKGDHGTDSN